MSMTPRERVNMEALFDVHFVFKVGDRVSHKTDPETAWIIIHREICQSLNGLEMIYRIASGLNNCGDGVTQTKVYEFELEAFDPFGAPKTDHD
jgi:hypothetical protein